MEVACSRGSYQYQSQSNYDLYASDKTAIQNAVFAYKGANGYLPTKDGIIAINSGEYDLINMCELVRSGFLGAVPLSSSSSNCNECSCPGGSYIWAVSDYGSVYSACVGGGCTNNLLDGFQGVYP